jgi:serine/threonine protein kinase
VKLLHPQYADGYSEQFLNEVQILHELKHEHIITFKGAFMNSEHCLIVTELARGRDLASLIKQSPEIAVWNSHGLTIAWQVARALFHMHTLPIPVVHGDLKPQNVLLTETFTAKVADFGLSKLNRDEDLSAMQAFSPDFSAPEVLKQQRGTAKIDIYSFGVILKQLVLLCEARNIKQREFPRKCPTELRNLIDACLSDDPSERPSAAELVKQMNRLRQYHCNSMVKTPRRRTTAANGSFRSMQQPCSIGGQ